jgi:hypothetical protein
METKMNTRTFDLGTVLSITTGVLFTTMDNVYDILNYMTGDELFTHQLPRASRECAPAILRQWLCLKEVDATNIDKTNWKEFLGKQIKKYGNEFSIVPLVAFEHKYIDPMEEAEQMIGSKTKIIKVII